MYCQKCGTHTDGKLCPNCGAPAQDETAETILNGHPVSVAQQEPIQKPKKKIPAWGIIAIILSLLMLIMWAISGELAVAMFMIGMFGTVIYAVFTAVSAIKKKTPKIPLIALIACMLISLSGIFIGVSRDAQPVAKTTEPVTQLATENAEEELIKENIDKNISGTHKGPSFKIDLKKNDDDKYDVKITLDYDRSALSYSCGYTCIDIIEGIRKYQPETDLKISTYSFTCNDSRRTNYTAEFINKPGDVKLALKDSSGKVYKAKTYDEYMKEQNEAEGTINYSTPSYLTDQQAIQLQSWAKQAVTSNLKAPSTAQFPGTFLDPDEGWEYYKDGDVYTVTSYVDSQNGFGAMIRSSFVVQIKWDGDSGKGAIVHVEIH